MFNKEKIHELYPEAEDLMFAPMLMWKLPDNKKFMFEEVCSNGEYFASIKKDGACYQFVKTENHSYLFGRTVSRTTGLLTEKIANVPHIQQALECLPANTILVMEIYYPGGTSKSVTPIMGALPPLAIERQKTNPIHAYIHDIIYYDGVNLMNTGALNRYSILMTIWGMHHLFQYDFLELARPIFDDIYETCQRVLADGEEGLVLRKKDGLWIPEKRPAWNTIKMKKMDTIDLVCIGFCDATMEYTGKLDLKANYFGSEADQWPYWWIFKKDPFGNSEMYVPYQKVPIGEQICIKGIEFATLPVTKGYYYGWKTAMRIGAYDDNGKLIEVGTVSSGLTDEDREKMSTEPENYLGHVFHFNCMEIDRKEHTLRHPALIGRREDKNAKECTIKGEFA